MPRLDGTQKREFLSNSNGRDATSQHAESGQEKRSFNENGTLASRTDAKGQRTAYVYDDKGRTVSVQRYDASERIQASQSVAYFYDANPFDAEFSQNAQNRLAAVQWGAPDILPGLMTEMYSYTSKGKMAAKRFRINRGGKDIDLDLLYSYDEKDRLSAVIYPKGGPSLKYTYDSSGRPILLMMGTEVLVKDVSYDSVTGRLVSYKQFLPKVGEYLEQRQKFDSKFRLNRIVAEFEQEPNPVVDIEYEYDAVHRLSREEDHVSNDVASYIYDASGRLKIAESHGTTDWKAEYIYDGFGNRVSQKNLLGAVPEITMTHDPATNRVVSNAVRYDDNGNIVKLFDMDLTFDIVNRLVAVERQGEGKEQYAYNFENLRIWKKLSTGEEEIHFYGTGGRRLATYRLTLDAQGNGDVSLLDNDIYFAGKLLRSQDKPVVLDRLGSVHAWIDSQNNVQRTKYYPFGEERKVTKHNRRKFATYWRDDFSKLDYAEQRYYSSALGRFITPDPYEGSVRLGNPETWNRYAYVWNDPVNKTDPHGLYPPTGYDPTTKFKCYQLYLLPLAAQVPAEVVYLMCLTINWSINTPPPPGCADFHSDFVSPSMWIPNGPGNPNLYVPVGSGLTIYVSPGGFAEYGGSWNIVGGQVMSQLFYGEVLDPRVEQLHLHYMNLSEQYGKWHVHPNCSVREVFRPYGSEQSQILEFVGGYGISDGDMANMIGFNMIADVQTEMVIFYGPFGAWEMPWQEFIAVPR
jgi:RHS repeat-associated protein